LLAALGLAASLLTPASAAAAPAEQAARCQFVLGFAQLRQLVGSATVGDCLENEHANASGDAVQQAAGGLLVWRRSDNVAAFTDGYRTWLNGPRGLQVRLNTESFDWEAAPGQSAAPAASGALAQSGCSRTAATVTLERKTVDGDAVQIAGTVTNGCAEPVDIQVDVVARAQPGRPDSRPLVDSPSVTVATVPAGGSKRFTARVPTAARAPDFSWAAYPIPTRLVDAVCVDVGASKCLTVDRGLWSAVSELLPFEQTRKLVQSAAEFDVTILRVKLPDEAAGVYSTRRKAIAVNEQHDQSSRWARAGVIAHELQHAADHRAGLLPTRAEAECLSAEERGFRTSSAFWDWVWQGGTPPSYDRLHAEHNAVALAASENPAMLHNAVARVYHDACARE
jgi:hypothetical protein